MFVSLVATFIVPCHELFDKICLLIYFVAIFYVQFDAGVNNINYVLLAKEAIVASLKLHILILPIIFLTTKRKTK